MKRRLTIVMGVILLAALPVAFVARRQSASVEPSGGILYAISSSSGSIEGSTLTLMGVPSVNWFTDRPERDAGHMSVGDFIAGWGQGTNSFAADPPNADLSILADAGNTEAVVELRSVSGDATALTFELGAIEGTLPNGDLGPSALFIDTGVFVPIPCELDIYDRVHAPGDSEFALSTYPDTVSTQVISGPAHGAFLAAGGSASWQFLSRGDNYPCQASVTLRDAVTQQDVIAISMNHTFESGNGYKLVCSPGYTCVVEVVTSYGADYHIAMVVCESGVSATDCQARAGL